MYSVTKIMKIPMIMMTAVGSSANFDIQKPRCSTIDNIQHTHTTYNIKPAVDASFTPVKCTMPS